MKCEVCCRTEDTAKLRASGRCPHASASSSSQEPNTSVNPYVDSKMPASVRPAGISPLAAAPFASMSAGIFRFMVSA